MPRIGVRKLYHMLYEQLRAMDIGRDKLFKILKSNNMLIKPVKSYRITTNSHHRFRKHKNIVKDIEYIKPNQVWVSDITYIGKRTNPSYLALITDAYSKKIVGYDVSDSLCTSGSIRALKMAIKKRELKNNSTIHHSDRGLQYCSNEYQSLLHKNDFRTSMTEKYDPYENAIAERINGILKQEFNVDKYNLELNYKQKLVKQAVEIYNNKRPHLSNSMLTPTQMHKQEKIKRKVYKKVKAAI